MTLEPKQVPSNRLRTIDIERTLLPNIKAKPKQKKDAVSNPNNVMLKIEQLDLMKKYRPVYKSNIQIQNELKRNLEEMIENGYRIDKNAVMNNLKELHPEYI